MNEKDEMKKKHDISEAIKSNSEKKLSFSAERKDFGRSSGRGSEKEGSSDYFFSESKGENLNRIDDCKYDSVRATGGSTIGLENKISSSDCDYKGKFNNSVIIISVI